MIPGLITTFDPDASMAAISVLPAADERAERVAFALYLRFLSQGSSRFTGHSMVVDEGRAARRWNAMPEASRTRWIELAEAALEAA